MTTRHLSTPALVAKTIRAELKRNGVPARVTSRSFSGGTSVDVQLLDAMPATVAAVQAFASRYQYGHFDGMTDGYVYSNRDEHLPQVSYVFVKASFSDDVVLAAKAYVAANPELTEWMDSFDTSVAYMAALTGRLGSFWTNRKERRVAA